MLVGGFRFCGDRCAERNAFRHRTRPQVVKLTVVQGDDEDTAILDEYERPVTRGDCVDGPRPCPWVSCAHHLYLDVIESGSGGPPAIRFNFPAKEVWELKETCALDVADRGGATLEEIGRAVNLTRERVRQMIDSSLRSARKATNPMFANHLDVEDVNDLHEPRHHLEEAE